MVIITVIVMAVVMVMVVVMVVDDDGECSYEGADYDGDGWS